MPCGIFPPISFMLLPRAQCSCRPMGCFRRRMHGYYRQIRRICCGSVPLLLRRKRTSAAGGTHRRFPGAAPLSGHGASAVRYGIPAAGMMLCRRHGTGFSPRAPAHLPADSFGRDAPLPLPAAHALRRNRLSGGVFFSVSQPALHGARTDRPSVPASAVQQPHSGFTKNFFQG